MYEPLVKGACWGAESDNYEEIEVKNSYGFVLWSCHFVWALNWLAIIKTRPTDKNVHVEFSVYRLVHRQTDKFLIKEREGERHFIERENSKQYSFAWTSGVH